MQHAYANINGIRMHYVTHGKGEPILFLHGFPEYWGIWKTFLAEFSKDHFVIAPDLRGYNLTSRPLEAEKYSMQHLVADVKALADHLGLQKLTVVSQDWGAFVGWSFVLRHPEYVRRFVSIGVTHPALFDRELRENPQQQQASQYMLFKREPNSSAAFIADDFAIWRKVIIEDTLQHSTTLTAEDVTEWVETWKHPGAIEAALHYYRATGIGPPDGKGSPGGSNLMDDLPKEKWKVNVPVLVLWGEHDPYLLPSGLRGLDQLVPDLTVHMIPGTTHWLALQKPALVTQHLREFLARGHSARGVPQR